MNDYTKGLIKDGVTNLLKRFMAKEIDENELIMELNTLNFLYKKGDKGIWFKWHEGHPLAITVWDIKAAINGNPRNRGYMYECIEATINDNSLVVNFS